MIRRFLIALSMITLAVGIAGAGTGHQLKLNNLRDFDGFVAACSMTASFAGASFESRSLKRARIASAADVSAPARGDGHELGEKIIEAKAAHIEDAHRKKQHEDRNHDREANRHPAEERFHRVEFSKPDVMWQAT
jgi:hypothetical protein